MEEQKYLFEVIKTKIGAKDNLVYKVMELLNLSINPAYRRIRGEQILTFAELLSLCKAYNLSLDEICNMSGKQGVLFSYAPVNFAEKGSYEAYIKRLAGSLAYYKSEKIEMSITAQDIPFFYFLDFPELMFFKLYAWNDTITRPQLSYEDFCKNLDKNTILPFYREMANSWQHIPSREIWTNQTLDTILRLLEYYDEIGAFENQETVTMLLNQLLELMSNVKKCANDGFKGGELKTPSLLYLCHVDFENNFMLIKRGEKMSCTIRLFTVNSLLTHHKFLCTETVKWIEDLIYKSVLISETSAKERSLFFRSSNTKIEMVIDKIAKMKKA